MAYLDRARHLDCDHVDCSSDECRQLFCKQLHCHHPRMKRKPEIDNVNYQLKNCFSKQILPRRTRKILKNLHPMIQLAHRLFHEPNFKRTVPYRTMLYRYNAKKSSFHQKIFDLLKVRFGTQKSSVHEKVDARTVLSSFFKWNYVWKSCTFGNLNRLWFYVSDENKWFFIGEVEDQNIENMTF